MPLTGHGWMASPPFLPSALLSSCSLVLFQLPFPHSLCIYLQVSLTLQLWNDPNDPLCCIFSITLLFNYLHVSCVCLLRPFYPYALAISPSLPSLPVWYSVGGSLHEHGSAQSFFLSKGSFSLPLPLFRGQVWIPVKCLGSNMIVNYAV